MQKDNTRFLAYVILISSLVLSISIIYCYEDYKKFQSENMTKYEYATGGMILDKQTGDFINAAQKYKDDQKLLNELGVK